MCRRAIENDHVAQSIQAVGDVVVNEVHVQGVEASKAPALDTPKLPSNVVPFPVTMDTSARPVLDALDAVSNPSSPESLQSPANAGDGAVSTHVQSVDIPRDPSERLLLLVGERGGDVIIAHRPLALALGISAGHVGNLMDKLSDAKKISVQSTRRGTRIRLLAA